MLRCEHSWPGWKGMTDGREKVPLGLMNVIGARDEDRGIEVLCSHEAGWTTRERV